MEGMSNACEYAVISNVLFNTPGDHAQVAVWSVYGTNYVIAQWAYPGNNYSSMTSDTSRTARNHDITTEAHSIPDMPMLSR